MKSVFAFLFIFCFASIIGQNNSIVINEFMSSNSTTIADEDGDYSDWIELHNPTDEAVNLKGWGLSDNESKPFKWVFPEVVIQPGEYLLVWASGKDNQDKYNSLREGALREIFYDIEGWSVNSLLSAESYPHSPSYSHIMYDVFNAPVESKTNFGQKIHGYINPPETGYYTFYIASDDNGRLFLSSDENPENEVLIAECISWSYKDQWDKYEEQESEEIYLEKDKLYSITALAKQGSGGDCLAVGWKKPNGDLERPMSLEYVFTEKTNLHTNFSISSEGEPLILTNKDGETVHYVPEVVVPTDFSYGLKEGKVGFFYYKETTPGKKNTTNSFREIIGSNLNFSHKGGFYKSEFDLEINSEDSDVQIYYTIDGSAPSPDNLNGTEYTYTERYPFGIQKTASTKTYLYTKPITIKNIENEPYFLGTINSERRSITRLPNSNYFKGTIIRAIAVKQDAYSLRPISHTYFVTNNDSEKYDIPVVSLIVNPIDLFDYEQGIYVPGKISDNWELKNPNVEWNNTKPANYNQTGQQWERLAHFEYFNNKDVFRQNIGVRIHGGGWGRAFQRKALRLYSRNKYDINNSFDYPFLNNLKAKGKSDSPITSFKRIMLRNSGNDRYKTLYRDALMQELIKESGITTMASRPVIHFINGEYWGIMNLRERYDKYFFESHYGISPDDVVMLKIQGAIEIGNTTDRNSFFSIVSFAEANDLNLNNNYNWIKERIDIEDLAQYYAAEIYFYNTDWPQNNIKYWKYREGNYSEQEETELDGRWRWLLYDTDFGLGLYGDFYERDGLSRVLIAEDPTSRIFKKLINNYNFKNLFSNIVADQLNSYFQPYRVVNMVDVFNEKLASSRSEHYNRWQSGIDEGESIKTFALERPYYVRQHTREYFDLGDDYDVAISRVGNGEVKINTIQINSELPGVPDPNEPYPWSGKYFGGVPIKLKAIENDSTIFAHWEGDVPEEIKYDKEIEVEINENSSFTAVFEEVKRDLIHYWHFNDLGKNELLLVEADESAVSISGTITYPGIGSGYMDRVKEGTLLNAQNDAEDGNALRVRNPSDTRSLEISIPTNGYESIKVNYAITRTSKGATHHSVYYKTDFSGSPILFRENIVANEDFRIIELDFSSILEVNNNENFSLIIKFEGEEASGDSGNNRFDNITVTGVSVGESTQISYGNFTKLNVYPNPVKDNINITSVERINNIRIIDIDGRVVLYELVDNYFYTNNISFLKDGIYILQINSNNGVERRKIIKK